MVYWNLSYFKQLYDQYTASGASVRVFCQSQGIKENRGCLTGVTLKEKENRELPESRQSITLTYPNGVVLQLGAGCDIEKLKQLVTLIS